MTKKARAYGAKTLSFQPAIVVCGLTACLMLMASGPVPAEDAGQRPPEPTNPAEPDAHRNDQHVLNEDPEAVRRATRQSSSRAVAASSEDDAEQTELEAEQQDIEDRRSAEMALDEDPDAVRRSDRVMEDYVEEKLTETGVPEKPEPEPAERRPYEFDFYASARVHYASTLDVESGERTENLSDGNSRMGIRADVEFVPGWHVFGRLELGFDALQLFDGKASNRGFGNITTRLANVGVEHDNALLTYGQAWSTYYKIAGMTDRFAIFGGNASGVYAAGRPGDYSGLGRAADVLQGRFYIDALEGFFDLKPFNLNVQYQQPQPIPFVDGEKYEYGYGASAWLETQSEIGIGIAYNRSVVPASAIVAGDTNGLDGDARAFATSFRWFGPKWYASLLYTDLENVEVTDQGRYIDATGVELYSQRQMTDRWWVIGGGNYLRPDDDEEDAGQFRIAYVVLGLRYTLRSFERMFYLEYKIDYGRTVDGRSGKDEVTIGIRWDF